MRLRYWGAENVNTFDEYNAILLLASNVPSVLTSVAIAFAGRLAAASEGK